MSCPADVSTGLVQLVGPIPPADLNNVSGAGGNGIRVNQSPVTISFAAQTTIPTLSKTQILIDNMSSNTCMYGSNRCTLVDVQLSSVMHTGYRLPENTTDPVAELILSFSSSNASMSGILMCMLVYDSGSTHHDTYLNQLVNPDAGTSQVASLDSLFYDGAQDASQTSLSYKTCFERVDSTRAMESGSLTVIVFPHGITMSSSQYQSLVHNMGTTLFPYRMPASIRSGDPTVRTYDFDDAGNKRVTSTSPDGNLYVTSVSTCTEDFRNRFEYYTKPPNRTTPTNRTAVPTNADGSTCRTTAQYKCVPFNELSDLSGNYVVLGNNPSLQTVLDSSKPPSTTSSESSGAISDIEDILIATGVVAILAMGAAYVVYTLSSD